MKSDRATEGDILGENRLLWNMLRISFALTHNEASEGNSCDTFFFWSGAGYRICMNRKRTLWSHGCKWNWSFLKPKWVPRDIVLALYITDWESCFVTACLIGSQRNQVIFCHRNHWNNPPFVESPCAVCIMAGWIDRNMDGYYSF